MLRTMKMARYLLTPLLFSLALAGCSKALTASEQLDALLTAYIEEYLREDPVQATYLGDNRYNDRFDSCASRLAFSQNK